MEGVHTAEAVIDNGQFGTVRQKLSQLLDDYRHHGTGDRVTDEKQIPVD